MHEEASREWISFAKMDLDTAIHIEAKMHPKSLEIICCHDNANAKRVPLA